MAKGAVSKVFFSRTVLHVLIVVTCSGSFTNAINSPPLCALYREGVSLSPIVLPSYNYPMNSTDGTLTRKTVFFAIPYFSSSFCFNASP